MNAFQLDAVRSNLKQKCAGTDSRDGHGHRAGLRNSRKDIQRLVHLEPSPLPQDPDHFRAIRPERPAVEISENRFDGERASANEMTELARVGPHAYQGQDLLSDHFAVGVDLLD